MEKKYKIMHDYGSYEGFVFADGEFETVEEAVKHGVAMNYSTPFIVVTVEWKPEYKKQ